MQDCSPLSQPLSLSLSDHSLWEKSTVQSSHGKEPKLPDSPPEVLLPDPRPLETRQDNKSCCLALLNLFHGNK